MGFRRRNKRILNDDSGTALAGQSVVQATAVVLSESFTPKQDFFGIWIDVSGVSSETLDVAVQFSGDEGSTWTAMEAAPGRVATAVPAVFAQWAANGAQHGWWQNPCGQGSPNDLIRLTFTAGSGDTVVLDSVYLTEGDLGGR